MNDGGSNAEPPTLSSGRQRFSAELMYSAATMYYLDDDSQAEIARQLGTSRATVSRVLSEARRDGIVKIEVIPPNRVDNDALSLRTADALGIEEAYIVPSTTAPTFGSSLASGLHRALESVDFHPGDTVLVSTGRTIYEVVTQSDLPSLQGVVVAPTIGGHDEPEPWYQPNEIARKFAQKVDGYPTFLYAPALPGPDLHETLLNDPSIKRVLDLWASATCAVVGVGAPPLLRSSIPRFIPTDAMSLREAVGDVCSRFYGRNGEIVQFPGSEFLMSTELDALRDIPVTIAIATGAEKLMSIVVGAKAGYFNRLVTDTTTAKALVGDTFGS